MKSRWSGLDRLARLSAFLLAASVPLCIWWAVKLPGAGIAIGALGAVGVIIALMGEKLQTPHRILWALVTLALLMIEVAAIKEDRAAQFLEHLRDLDRQQKIYARDLFRNQSEFEGTLARLQGLGDLSTRAIKLSSETVNQLTGGETYLYFDCQSPMGPIEFPPADIPKGAMVSNCFHHIVGKYPVEAHVSVDGSLGRYEIDYGQINSEELGRGRQVPTLVFFPDKPYHFNIVINTRSANYSQAVIFRKFNEKWEWVNRLFKIDGNKQRVIRTFSSPGFPKELIDSDWNKTFGE
jgi:hypothetical protein